MLDWAPVEQKVALERGEPGQSLWAGRSRPVAVVWSAPSVRAARPMTRSGDRVPQAGKRVHT